MIVVTAIIQSYSTQNYYTENNYTLGTNVVTDSSSDMQCVLHCAIYRNVIAIRQYCTNSGQNLAYNLKKPPSLRFGGWIKGMAALWCSWSSPEVHLVVNIVASIGRYI